MAERIFVGKDPAKKGGSGFSQQEINDLLVAKAREGKRVVRLKGGDPFVFGRGGEEAEALVAAGIPFEVVSGVSSAMAAPAYAGIPVTHRGLASSFTVVTGHEDPDKAESAVDWQRIAKSADTLVILMGGANLGNIMKLLVEGGRSPDEPVAVIRWGTTPAQQVVVGTVSDVAERVAEAGLTPPLVTVVGPVVRLREKLRWFENRPLFGKRVVVTRAREQAVRHHARPDRGRRRAHRAARHRDRAARRPEGAGAGVRTPRGRRIRLDSLQQRQRRRRLLRAAASAARRTPARWARPHLRHRTGDEGAALEASAFAPTSCRSASWRRASSRRWRSAV